MTPQEKAKELFNHLYVICAEYTEEIQCSIQAKQCALIAADQLIKEHTWKNPIQWNGERKRFWESVKSEIEKL